MTNAAAKNADRLALDVGAGTLHRCRRMTTIDELITLFAGWDADSAFPATVIGWSASRVAIARVDSTSFAGPGATKVDPRDWYEARMFNGVIESRWIRRGAGSGEGVVISEGELELPDWDDVSVEVAAKIGGVHALVWGRTSRPIAEGWWTLTSARIGTIHVPGQKPIGEGRSVRLTSIEYLGVGVDGNAVIVDERIVGFEPADEVDTHQENGDEG